MENLILVYNKHDWLVHSIIKWTEEEIDNADERGFIGTVFGVDCYVSKSLNTNNLFKRNKRTRYKSNKRVYSR